MANEQNAVKAINQDYDTQINTMADRMLLKDVAQVEQELADRTLCLTTLSASLLANHSEQVDTLPLDSSNRDENQIPNNVTLTPRQTCSHKIQNHLEKAQTEALDQRQIAEAAILQRNALQVALSRTNEEARVAKGRAEVEGVRNDALEIANDKLTRKVVELQDREVMHYRMLQAASQTIAGLEDIVRCNNIYTGPASSAKYRVSASQQLK
ncbi:hypothetical protein LTR42_003803 [Elasticomyces elasticus]|nr:hypothetical protein LTR42_003803 [Elasticomyces elasticus]